MPIVSKFKDSNGTVYDIRDNSKSIVSVTRKTTSGTNIADITIDGTTTELYAPTGGGGGAEKNVWYGYSTSASNSATRTVTTTSGDFTLTNGNMVRVLFTNANNFDGITSLAVDGTTAKTVAKLKPLSADTTTRYYWTAGEVVDFVYDGTNFLMSAKGTATTSYYGLTKLSSSTSSTSTALAATPSAVKSAYDLAGSKSEVSVSQTITTGTEIASITIDGTSTSLYAPAGTSVTVDDALSTTSENPVQNKVINTALTAKSSVEIVRW